MRHRFSHILKLFAYFWIFLSSPEIAFADFIINSEGSRQAIVNSARSKKFFTLDNTLSRLAIGGSYDTDQNSKQYQGTLRYFYQSNKAIHDINFLQEAEFSDSGSGKNKRSKTKTSELTDLALSSKLRFPQSNNYFAFYHRTAYDPFSNYYYDLHTAIGLGRMFFNDNFELDFSIGQHISKNFGTLIDFIPSLRLNFKLTKNLTLNQRGFWFLDKRSTDNELKTSLIYRLSPKTSFEVRHTYEQRRYEDQSKRQVTNQVRNLTTFGMIFDLQ